jgi:5-formyltetrahydrofolate cyclo-ligase
VHPVEEERHVLRAAGRLARSRITGAARVDATAAVIARLLALPEVQAAGRVLVTAAVGDELDLAGLRGRLRERGTTVALPVVDGDGLLPVDLVQETDVAPGWRDVPEPVGPPSPGPIDVVVVPALVLDRRGGRLGYGGGHFDRFLAGPASDATSIGAVFHDQLVEDVPTLDHDVTLDVVVTDQGVWRGGAAVS